MTTGIGAWVINQDLFCKNKPDFAPTLSLHALTALLSKKPAISFDGRNHTNTHEKTSSNSCAVFGRPIRSHSAN